MNQPTFQGVKTIDNSSLQLGAWLPVADMGLLPVNAYLIKAARPVLIDTGLAATATDFLQALQQQIDPADLHYLWLTHMDPDHLGNLQAVLALAPQVTLVTSFLGAGKLGLWGIEHPHLHIIGNGETLDAGDRELLAVAPPCYDAPETLGCFDAGNRVLYSADCFGGLLQSPLEEADAISDSERREGIMTWSQIDTPWLASVSRRQLARHCAQLLALEPSRILSSHLPPAQHCQAGLIDDLLACASA